MLKILFFTFLTLLSSFSWAHTEAGDGDPYETILRYSVLLERIAALETQVTTESTMDAVPFVRMNGKKYYLNNAFYQHTEDLIRIYSDEIKKMCPECVLPTAEEINDHIKKKVAKGWASSTTEKATQNVLGRYGTEFVNLGARYGKGAGLTKVALELIEDALLVVFKMPGAHFLCDFFTMVIAARFGHALSLYSVWSNASGLGRNGLRQMGRLVATSWLVKRAMNKVRLEFAPVQVDPRLLAGEHIHDSRKDWLAHEIEDERSFRRFFEKFNTILESSNRQIAQLQAQKLEASASEARSIDKKIKRIQNRLERTSQVSRKVFEGRKVGFAFWLIKRNGLMTMYSSEPDLNEFLKGTRAWMVPLTSTITTPGFDAIASERLEQFRADQLEERQARKPWVETDTDRVLLEEGREQKLNPEVLKAMFRDIDNIFDTSKSPRERYLDLTIMDGFLNEFLTQLNKQYMGELYSEIFHADPRAFVTMKFWNLQWHVGRITRQTNEYLNYLRSVALVRGRNNLTHESAFAKDYLIHIFKNYEILAELKDFHNPEVVKSVKVKLKEHSEEIEATQFWKEKVASHKILPIAHLVSRALGFGNHNLYRRRPQCAQLYY